VRNFLKAGLLQIKIGLWLEAGVECGAGHGKDCGVDLGLQTERGYV